MHFTRYYYLMIEGGGYRHMFLTSFHNSTHIDCMKRLHFFHFLNMSTKIKRTFFGKIIKKTSSKSCMYVVDCWVLSKFGNHKKGCFGWLWVGNDSRQNDKKKFVDEMKKYFFTHFQ